MSYRAESLNGIIKYIYNGNYYYVYLIKYKLVSDQCHNTRHRALVSKRHKEEEHGTEIIGKGSVPRSSKLVGKIQGGDEDEKAVGGIREEIYT